MIVSPPFGLPTQAHPRKVETKTPSPRGFPYCDHTPSLLGAHKDIKRSIPPSGFSEVQISGDAYSFSEFFTVVSTFPASHKIVLSILIVNKLYDNRLKLYEPGRDCSNY